MKHFRRTVSVIVAVLLCTAIITYWNWADGDSVKDGDPPTPAPTVPQTATPSLVSSSPLPVAERSSAKPVIAADRAHRIVVAQDVVGFPFESRLVQWRSDNGFRWSDPLPLKDWPPESHVLFDPWIETDRRGRYYLVHGSLFGDGGSLVFRRSTDSAQTWSFLKEVAKGADRPVLGISPSGKHLVIAASLAERTKAFSEASERQRPAVPAGETRCKIRCVYSFLHGHLLVAGPRRKLGTIGRTIARITCGSALGDHRRRRTNCQQLDRGEERRILGSRPRTRGASCARRSIVARRPGPRPNSCPTCNRTAIIPSTVSVFPCWHLARLA